MSENLTLAEHLKKLVAESIARDADPAHTITWLICRHAYALGFAKGFEGGRQFPNDDKGGTLESGHWWAGYAFADPAPTWLPTPATTQ